MEGRLNTKCLPACPPQIIPKIRRDWGTKEDGAMSINLATIPKTALSIALLAALSLAVLAAVVAAPPGTAFADATSGETPPAPQADTPETPEPAATPMPTPEPTTRLTNERDAEGDPILYDPVWRGNTGAV